jgi:hypothetical protein
MDSFSSSFLPIRLHTEPVLHLTTPYHGMIENSAISDTYVKPLPGFPAPTHRPSACACLSPQFHCDRHGFSNANRRWITPCNCHSRTRHDRHSQCLSTFHRQAREIPCEQTHPTVLPHAFDLGCHRRDPQYRGPSCRSSLCRLPAA